MKLFVISDIHGSCANLKLALERFEESRAERLLILGDLYYHGPRNPLPEGYDPQGCAKLLNAIKDQVIAVKGNCDAEVDQMISDFKLKSSLTIDFGHKVIFASHGHRYNPEHLPEEYFDLLLFGHTHCHEFRREDGYAVANPGSISLPKDGHRSYLTIDGDGTLRICDLASGETLTKEIF